MRERLRQFWLHLWTENSSPEKVAAAVFLGLFLGILPVYGFQTMLVLGCSKLFRVNRITALLFAQISMPPIAPFLLAGGLYVGEFIRFGAMRWPGLSWEGWTAKQFWSLYYEAPDMLVSLFLGDALLGVAVGGAVAGLVYLALRFMERPGMMPVSEEGAVEEAHPQG